MNFSADILTLFDKGWALVTAGDISDFNTMTISWGGIGGMGPSMRNEFLSKYKREQPQSTFAFCKSSSRSNPWKESQNDTCEKDAPWCASLFPCFLQGPFQGA